MLKALFQLPRTVWLLGLVSLFNDATSELVYPLVPLFLASVLMAGPQAMGVIEGIAEATASLLKLFSGAVSDRFGHTKAWVVGGYSLAALSRPLFYLAASWPVVLALRFADRVGKGLRTSPRDALLAATVPEGQRGLAFGLHRALDNGGAVVGPLVAAWLLAEGVALRDIFLWAVVPGVITVAFTLALKEPAALPGPKPRFSWKMEGFSATYKRYLLVLALFTLGNSSNMFLLLRAKDLGLPDYQVPLLWALTSGVAMVLSTPLSALSDRLGRVRLILAGWAVYGLFYLLLGVNQFHPLLLWPLFAFYGVFLAATEGAEKALVADLAPQDRLGTAYGWFHMTVGVLLLPASLVFGGLWQDVSAEAAFAFSAGCALGAALLLKFWVRLPQP